jgi:hypothetical protein
VENIGYKFYIVCLPSWKRHFLPVIYFFYPETAGLSLESIDMLFAQEQARDAAAVQDDEKPEISMEEDLPIDNGIDLDRVHITNKV